MVMSASILNVKMSLGFLLNDLTDINQSWIVFYKEKL